MIYLILIFFIFSFLCFHRFSCCDLDGDGALSPEEMRHFYKNQILRVTNLVRTVLFLYITYFLFTFGT